MKLRLTVLATLAILATAGDAYAADKLTVLLDWYVNANHAPLIVAKEGGYFERAGLDVDLVALSEPATAPGLVAAGKGDIAITYQPDLMLQIAEGLPLVRFGTLIETPLNSLIALKDGPIKSLADLKGRKIGISVVSVQGAYLTAMLRSVGLTEDDVTMVNVGFSLVPALLAGQVDAIVDGYRNVELIQIEIEGKPGIAFYPEEHGVPPYDELIYVANSAKRDDARLKRFLAAIEEATIFLTNHPDEALEMFLKSHTDLDDELNRRAFALTLPRFAKRPAALDRGRYDRFAAFLKNAGLIDAVPPIDSYAIEPR
jgi:putative hydroxymethylpyrimidine transport system substrate-binding protein